MRVAAVIPSRYQSSRFPGKPLARIAGRSMIERVYRRAAAAGCFADVIVATDDERIRVEVAGFGGNAEMTDRTIESGTERVWAVVEKKDFDAVVNIQGDEPLIAEELLGDVCRALGTDAIVSAARRNDSYEDFRSPHVVKVVCDRQDRALFFSRAPIPFAAEGSFNGFLQHIGIYGYTKEMLRLFVTSGSVELEMKENLEQLRFLFLGRPIRIVRTDFVSHGVDVPQDIARIEELLRS
ncbi:MAG: 3-deoxy-manno-octulosonate cytidylyltransferase [Acidobacteria bacterium]|jgi:3-deoxy-manno-octulosonate cytidylyltransferase (CMP-KDO synthetase)|nr:3-deoxy-manno-octulosonate cytidylyltransferase [Acidobacteriota bacterium]